MEVEIAITKMDRVFIGVRRYFAAFCGAAAKWGLHFRLHLASFPSLLLQHVEALRLVGHRSWVGELVEPGGDG